MPLPPAGPPEWTVDLDDLDGLPRLRAEVQDWAGRHGFAVSAAVDVLLAVGEVATNGLVHGRPTVRVYGWRQHNTLAVQADDQGGIPLPPLAGYLPPGQRPPSQRGLWLPRQLADVVQGPRRGRGHLGPALLSLPAHPPQPAAAYDTRLVHRVPEAG